jgi:hypothetical protein
VVETTPNDHRAEDTMTKLTKTARRGAATMLALTFLLGVGVVTGQSASAALPASVSGPIKRADAALATARKELALDHPVRANDALTVVQRQVPLANTAAGAQIGKPPVDPESDDIPGPPAVMAALSLDHRVANGVVPLFDGQARPRIVDSLLLTLEVTHKRRNALLGKVIALPAEGDFGEYADLIADKLAIYGQEVTQVKSALATYTLTPAARDGLQIALVRVTATKAKVQKAFGGGE